MTAQRDAIDKAVAFLQSPRHALTLSTTVINELSEVDGFDALPDELREAIERRAAQLYGAGFVRGVLWQGKLEKNETH